MSKELAYILQQALNAAQLATFYVPLAVAFALIQAITRKVFLSFGDVAMFGSFAAVYVCFASLLQGNDDLPSALISLAAAIACAAAFGHVSAHYVFAPLINRSSQAFMIAAIGFSIAIQELMRLTSGGRDIWIPPLLQGDPFILLSGAYSLQISRIAGLSIILMGITVAALTLIIAKTRFGRNWQACSQEMSLAKLCGVNTDAVLRQTFMLGSGLAAVSGWIAAISYGGTSFSSGLMLGFKAMFAAVIGGFGSVRGAIFGALSLAVLEVLWSGTFSSSYRDVGVFSFIVFVLLLRPEGLSGIKSHRESEAL
jgi:branched-chain amino acid transport system permease protein